MKPIEGFRNENNIFKLPTDNYLKVWKIFLALKIKIFKNTKYLTIELITKLFKVIYDNFFDLTKLIPSCLFCK